MDYSKLKVGDIIEYLPGKDLCEDWIGTKHRVVKLAYNPGSIELISLSDMRFILAGHRHYLDRFNFKIITNKREHLPTWF